MSTPCSLQRLRSLYAGEAEFALIDPREEAFFTRAHLFAASNLPMSRLELLAPVLIPQRDVPVIICDDGDGLALRCATVLRGLGYTAVERLDGGLPGWALAGGAVFSGKNVPSKAFGEFVERHYRTPSISAEALRERLETGQPTLLYDARPEVEHEDFCISGGICCPSTELLYRAPPADTDVLVVVHCAGRTRSIIGAQTLIDGDYHDSIVWLHNGTPAWDFAGFALERGNRDPMPAPLAGRGDRQQRAAELRARWGINLLESDTVAAWRAGSGTRYVIDVRTAAEFARGHMPGAKHVPGGQLLQNTDQHLVVRNAMVLLVDQDEIRASMTAVWLRRMGWRNVSVTSIDPEGGDLVQPGPVATDLDAAHSVDLAGALALQADGAMLCDCRNAVAFKTGHIPGAFYLNREDLARDAAALPARVVLTGDDPAYAGLIARDLAATGRTVFWLADDPAAYGEQHALAAGVENLISRPVDIYLEAEHFDDPRIFARENHAYLNWEIALIDHIDGEPAVHFEMPRSQPQ